MGAARPEAQLAVVAEHATAHDLVFAGERRAAGVHGLDDAVFQEIVSAGQHHRAVLSHIGRKPKSQPAHLHVSPFHAENLLPHGSFDEDFVEVAAAAVPHQQHLVGDVHEECARSELAGGEDLAQQIAVDGHLFTTADEAVILVAGMRHVLDQVIKRCGQATR